MEQRLAGKVIFITGASTGIGEATARHLSLQGHRVVLAHDAQVDSKTKEE